MKALGKIAILLSPLLVTGVGSAQQELVLSSHHLLRGQVTASTADSVTFVHDVDGKSVSSVFKASDLDPHSFYIVRTDALADDDAAGHAALGKYCQANGLYTRARNQFHEAAKIDPSMAGELKGLHDQCVSGSADQLLAQAKASQAAGRIDQAGRQSLEVIRYYPDTPAADEARKLNQAVHEQGRTKAKAVAASQSAKEASEGVQAAQRLIERAEDENRKGLYAKELSGGLHFFKESVGNYQKALEELGKERSADKTISALVRKTKAEAIDVYINAGSIYLTRSDYQGALEQANAALAIDQQSSAAQSFRARVGSASASSSDYGGVIIRRR